MTPVHDQLAANYRAARARLSPRPPKPLPVAITPPPPSIIDLVEHIGTKAKARLIIDEVVAKHDVTHREILSSDRRSRIALARAEASYRMRTEITVHGKPMSFPMIGAVLNKDHSTVIWQANKWFTEYLGKDFHDEGAAGGD